MVLRIETETKIEKWFSKIKIQKIEYLEAL